MKTLPLQFAGEALIADAARALVWPARQALLIADLHLGKAQVFRQAGIAMPEGDDENDLRRLSEVVTRHAVEQLFLLGDIVHGATSDDANWRSIWQRFASDHRALEITAIVGNHDRHDRHALADTATIATEVELGHLRLRHHPVESPDTSASTLSVSTIAGHLHPLAVIADGGRHFRLPCFWLRAAQLILPAFGSTTRGSPIDAAPGDHVIAVTPAGLIDVSKAVTTPRRGRRGG